MKLLERTAAYLRLRQYREEILDIKGLPEQSFETQERIRKLEKEWKELRNRMITVVPKE